ncbi:hypothetical protein QEA29_003866 [Salmonella enterica]|nr:hypothetical protein [Salmonella enterica]EKT1325607.1 hypothetical protein [Salmonella enterica]EKT1358742.1 hypothetical protein [Salmonella enterica]EKT2634776.1 hypothetical protein [Salmonella enterica]EKT3223713.1 hypothetical protein [Salmonella enterica]
MSDLRNNQKIQDPLRSGNIGYMDFRREKNSYVNQAFPLPPDVPDLDEYLFEKNRDIMILTITEAMRLLYDNTLSTAGSAYSKTSSYYHTHSARQITVDILNVYDNSSKKGVDIFMLSDSLEYLKNSRSLMTYYDQAGDLAWKISSLWKVRATSYIVNGTSYIKITGYAGLRRILKGTRYIFTNPQLMELGIGRKGVLGKAQKGIKLNIWFSAAFHALQFLFDSEYDFVDFFVDIPMDVAKLIVTNLVVSAVAGFLTFVGTPVILAGLLIIAAAVVTVVILEWLDGEVFHISDSFKKIIREGLALHSQQLMHDVKTLPPWQYMLVHPRGF